MRSSPDANVRWREASVEDEEKRALERQVQAGDQAAADRLAQRPMGEVFQAWEATWIVHRQYGNIDHHHLGFYVTEEAANAAGKLEKEARDASCASVGTKEEFCHVVQAWLVQSVRGPMLVASSSGRTVARDPVAVACHADAAQGRRSRLRAAALAKLSDEEARALGVRP